MNGHRILFSCCELDAIMEYESPIFTSLFRMDAGEVEFRFKIVGLHPLGEKL